MKHHHIVQDLACTHFWSIAIDYDIQQREMATCHLEHDLSTLDDKCLTLVSTATLLAHQAADGSQPPTSLKRSRVEPSNIGPNHKCVTRLCFQCGFAGHLPVDCKAESTCAGRPVATLSTNAQSRNALVGPDSKWFCFSWAKDSACSFGDKCRNHHSCSLCGGLSHGAAQCKTRT